MSKTSQLQSLPSPFDGISVIYFDDENRNRYVELPADKELAKQLASLLYHEIKITISKDKQKEQIK